MFVVNESDHWQNKYTPQHSLDAAHSQFDISCVQIQNRMNWKNFERSVLEKLFILYNPHSWINKKTHRMCDCAILIVVLNGSHFCSRLVPHKTWPIVAPFKYYLVDWIKLITLAFLYIPDECCDSHLPN